MTPQEWNTDFHPQISGDHRRQVISEKILLASVDIAFFEKLVDTDPCFRTWPVTVANKLGKASRLLHEAYSAIHGK